MHHAVYYRSIALDAARRLRTHLAQNQSPHPLWMDVMMIERCVYCLAEMADKTTQSPQRAVQHNLSDAKHLLTQLGYELDKDKRATWDKLFQVINRPDWV